MKEDPPRGAHVSVCVCTYRRPSLLQSLLRQLGSQELSPGQSHDIIVVDNDSQQSARTTVTACANATPAKITYLHEPRKNIALARNVAVHHAHGDMIAFIDDDEEPPSNWLLTLTHARQRYHADSVLGPVRPRIPATAPPWLVRSGILERPEHETGTVLSSAREMRTGNVLFCGPMLKEVPGPFNPRFGLTGGEDVDLFERLLAQGRRFVWCNEAPVYETVHADRLTRRYHVQRALLRGATAARRDTATVRDVVRSSTAILCYSAALPAAMLLGQHLVVRYLIKACDHAGKLLAHLGLHPVKAMPMPSHAVPHPARGQRPSSFAPPISTEIASAQHGTAKKATEEGPIR